jgi:uncharacterized protein
MPSQPDGVPGTGGRERKGTAMARFDMDTADLAAMAPAADSAMAGEACLALGMMYASGRSVAVDLVAAHKWFNVAAHRGCRAAVAHRAEVARDMSADEVAAALREARLFLSATRH